MNSCYPECVVLPVYITFKLFFRLLLNCLQVMAGDLTTATVCSLKCTFCFALEPKYQGEGKGK